MSRLFTEATAAVHQARVRRKPIQAGTGAGETVATRPLQARNQPRPSQARSSEHGQCDMGWGANPPTVVAPRVTAQGKDKYPAMLAEQIALAGLGVAEMEYRFHPTRKWRFDLAFNRATVKVAIEIEGQVHKIGEKWLRDLEKHNESMLMGWCTLRVTPDMVRDCSALELVRRALNG